MFVAPLVASVEAGGLDCQLPGDGARPNVETATELAEHAANGRQPPHRFHGEPDLTAVSSG